VEWHWPGYVWLQSAPHRQLRIERPVHVGVRRSVGHGPVHDDNRSPDGVSFNRYRTSLRMGVERVVGVRTANTCAEQRSGYCLRSRKGLTVDAASRRSPVAKEARSGCSVSASMSRSQCWSWWPWRRVRGRRRGRAGRSRRHPARAPSGRSATATRAARCGWPTSPGRPLTVSPADRPAPPRSPPTPASRPGSGGRTSRSTPVPVPRKWSRAGRGRAAEPAHEQPQAHRPPSHGGVLQRPAIPGCTRAVSWAHPGQRALAPAVCAQTRTPGPAGSTRSTVTSFRCGNNMLMTLLITQSDTRMDRQAKGQGLHGKWSRTKFAER